MTKKIHINFVISIFLLLTISVFLVRENWYLRIAFIITTILAILIYGYYISLVKILKETKKEKHPKIILECLFKPLIKGILKNKLDNYIKNSSRVYLKINFGRDVLKERDILRLITRTLSTEYNNFCRSWKHTFHWRILSLVIILFASYLFYYNIYKEDLRQLIEQKSDYYAKSSQLYYASDNIFIEKLYNEICQEYNGKYIYSDIKNAKNTSKINKIEQILETFKNDTTRACSH